MGTLFRAGMALNGFFGGVLLGIFLLGMISRRANPRGALMGGCLGLTLVVAVAYLSDSAPVWYPIISTFTTLGGGYACSWLFERQNEGIIGEYVVGRRATGASGERGRQE